MFRFLDVYLKHTFWFGLGVLCVMGFFFFYWCSRYSRIPHPPALSSCSIASLQARHISIHHLWKSPAHIPRHLPRVQGTARSPPPASRWAAMGTPPLSPHLLWEGRERNIQFHRLWNMAINSISLYLFSISPAIANFHDASHYAADKNCSNQVWQVTT